MARRRLDFALDPLTLDLVPSAGWFAMDETATAAVVYQIDHERDGWDGDPEAGSLLHKAKELGASSDAVQFSAIETARAMNVLAGAELISDVAVAAKLEGLGAMGIETSHRDNATGDLVEREVTPFE